jgi:hypothetical protein
MLNQWTHYAEVKFFKRELFNYILAKIHFLKPVAFPTFQKCLRHQIQNVKEVAKAMVGY